ncbi:MAG: hypothetical protein ACOH2M_27780 [Cypionkella sp.]
MKSTKITRSETALIYHILFIVNDKGGTRKSTLLIFLLSLLLMERMRALAFEIDDQGRVGHLFGDIVNNLILPDADSLSKSSLGDTAILAPMLAAMTESAGDRTILIEVGANLAERVAFALKANSVAAMIGDDTRIGILTPIDASDDAIALGARSALLIQSALPKADIIIVQPRAHLGIDITSPNLSPAAREGFSEVIEAALRTRGALIWPLMTADMRHAFEALRTSPTALLNADDRKLGAAGYDPSRMDFEQSEQTMVWIGRRLKAEFRIYLAELIMETARMLGFPRDPE